MATHTPVEAGSGPREASGSRLGLVAEPDLPHRVADHLVPRLEDDLGGGGWEVEVLEDAPTAGAESADAVLRETSRLRERHGWDYAVCLTDLPVRSTHHPVLGQVDVEGRVALVSLPALGAVQPFRRSEQMVHRVVEDLLSPADRDGHAGLARRGLTSPLTRLVAPIERTCDTGEAGERIRYVGTRGRGRARLLGGMVRANSPWRLVLGLSSALAAALAASVFGLSSSTIWQIVTQLGPLRLGVTSLGAVGVLVAWLVATHGLWERPGRGSVRDREQAMFYNVSTLTTLTLGVAVMYAVLLVVNTGVAVLLVPSGFLGSTLGEGVTVDWRTYLALGWGFSTMGLVAGALGSSLESDDDVRRAAYGYREQQRRTRRAETEDRQHPTEETR